jgi:hypothetical protein
MDIKLFLPFLLGLITTIIIFKTNLAVPLLKKLNYFFNVKTKEEKLNFKRSQGLVAMYFYVFVISWHFYGAIIKLDLNIFKNMVTILIAFPILFKTVNWLHQKVFR